MERQTSLDFWVGLFVMFALACFVWLAWRSSTFTQDTRGDVFYVTARFDQIGNLKTRAPVRVAGVRVGEIRSIRLDPKSLRAIVTLAIQEGYHELPKDSSARIFTEGLLGSQYIGLIPGMEMDFLEDGDHIESTQSAVLLENLISQMLFKPKPK